jgi:hypothetical protein
MLDICARNCFVAEVLPPFLPVYFLFSLLVLPLFVHGMAAAKGAGKA